MDERRTEVPWSDPNDKFQVYLNGGLLPRVLRADVEGGWVEIDEPDVSLSVIYGVVRILFNGEDVVKIDRA